VLFFRRESILDAWAELLPLAAQHYAEVDPDAGAVPFDLDRAGYAHLTECGALSFFTVRDSEVGDALCGYASYIVAPALHQRGRVVGYHDALWLSPAYRGGGTASSFLRYCEDALIGQGCAAATQHTRPKHDHGAWLKRRGYVLSETIYTKRLHKEA